MDEELQTLYCRMNYVKTKWSLLYRCNNHLILNNILIEYSMDMSLNKLWEMVDSTAWCAGGHVVAKSQSRLIH